MSLNRNLTIKFSDTMRNGWLLVDYDGTLHDSDSKFIAEFKQPARALGLDEKKFWKIYLFDVHRGIIHNRFPSRHDDLEFHCELVFGVFGKPFDPDIADRIIKAYQTALEECWKNPSFFGDAFEFLKRAVKARKLCLATSGYAKEKAACIERIGRRKYFDFMLDENNTSFRKTEKGYYLKALELLKSTPGKTAVIGDTLTHDILPAKSVGIKTIWVNRSGEQPEGLKPDHEVKNLLEALVYL